MNRKDQIKKWIKSGADARRGKSKYSSNEEKLKAKRKSAREYVKRSYAKNPEKWKNNHKKYWANATEDQKDKRRKKLNEYTKAFRKRDPDKPKKYYQMLKDAWTGGIDCRDKKIWKTAELIASDLVEGLGYKELFTSGFSGFYFDLLAKKNNKIFAFQVTTLRTRLIKNKHIELAKYLGLEFYIIHIKPTFDYAYIMKIEDKIQNKNGKYYHYRKGKECKL